MNRGTVLPAGTANPELSDPTEHLITVHLADGGIHSWSRMAVKLASKGVVVRGFHADVSQDPGWSRVVVHVSSLGQARAAWLCRHLRQLVDVVQVDLRTAGHE